MPDDSPLGGRLAEKIALRSPVALAIRSGLQSATVGGTKNLHPSDTIAMENNGTRGQSL